MRSLILGMLIWSVPTFASAAETTESPVLTLQDVQCRGNEATACPFIAGQLYLSVGDSIIEEEIQNAKLRLSLLDNFKSVDVHLQKGAEKNQAIVVIEVVEASPVTNEFLIGTSFEGRNLSQRIAGRTSYNNLFGLGKIIDLEVDFRTPLGELENRNESARIQYVDPRLFGSAKNFMIAGAEYQNSKYTTSYGYSYLTEQFGFDVHFGRRFNNFSYVSLGYQHRPMTRARTTYADPIYGDSVYDSNVERNSVILGTGWNDEDDPYFPTRGSRAQFSARWSWAGASDSQKSLLLLGAAFRRTWKIDSGSYWYYNVGGAPRNEFRQNLDEQMDLSIGYARDFGKSDSFGGIERGRWYIEPGLPRSYSTFSHGSIGLKTGVRLETKSFGIVDLYAFAANGFVGRNQ